MHRKWLLSALLIPAVLCAQHKNGKDADPNDLPQKSQLARTPIPEIAEYRKLWFERTKGVNLALGKRVEFSIRPGFRLTRKDGTDPFDLTDGKISKDRNELIWFDSGAVGWWIYEGAINGVNLLVDLGKEEDVSTIVIRALGGREQVPMAFPGRFEAFVSRDGKNFYRTDFKQGVSGGETELAGRKTAYYFDESGKRSFVYPMELEVNASTRYVGLTVTGAADSFFTDELAVMKAEKKGPGFNAAYAGIPEAFPMKGIAVEPRLKELIVSRGVVAPNHFVVKDMREKKDRTGTITLKIEVPGGIELLFPKADSAEDRPGGRKLFTLKTHVNQSRTSAVYFRVLPSFRQTPDAHAGIFAEAEGYEPVRTSVPVGVIDIPEVPRYKRMNFSVWGNYPEELLGEFVKLGFNGVTVFPYRWRGKDAEFQAFIRQARQLGFTINMIGVFGYTPDRGVNIPKERSHEVCSDLADGKKSVKPCPAYRGEFYRRALEGYRKRIETALYPDIILNDFEGFSSYIREAPYCRYCQEGMKKTGLNLKDFLAQCGTEIAADLHKEVEEAYKGRRMPGIAYYNIIPGRVFQDVFDFRKLYGKYTFFAQPVCYLAGDMVEFHERIAGSRRLMKDNRVFPWLTAGTYGEFEPEKIEFQLLETLLNGGCGGCYFYFADFDTPRDFYFHAKALKMLQPYESFLLEGTPFFELPGTNRAHTVSAVRNGKELMILVGNYRSAAGENTLTLPSDNIVSVRDIRDGKPFSLQGARLSFEVPKGDVRLFLVLFR